MKFNLDGYVRCFPHLRILDPQVRVWNDHDILRAPGFDLREYLVRCQYQTSQEISIRVGHFNITRLLAVTIIRKYAELFLMSDTYLNVS